MGNLGSCLDLELKPPKISRNSSKVYKGLFLRKLKNFTHIYALDGLYVCSIHKSIDVHEWIDRKIDIINERINELGTQQQRDLFSF